MTLADLEKSREEEGAHLLRRAGITFIQQRLLVIFQSLNTHFLS